MANGARPKNATRIGRRTFIKTAVGGSLALTAAGRVLADTKKEQSTPASAFRFVFMPCIHFRYDLGSPEGLATCLKTVSGLAPRPDFLLTGGDMLQNLRDDSLDGSRRRVRDFKAVWAKHTDVETRHCFGNHDLAAWNDKGAAGDPDYGKGLLRRELEMPGTYYSFDHGGWHFVVMDYLKEEAPGQFSPEFDAKQLAWLKQDLAQAGQRPTMLVNHAPFLSAYEAYTDRGIETEKGRITPFGRVVKNLAAVLDVIQGANVRALISGHLHIVEEIRYGGHRFLCCGSVSGHQWTGPRLGCPEGFSVFDCRADGGFDFRYQDFGWKARK